MFDAQFIFSLGALGALQGEHLYGRRAVETQATQQWGMPCRQDGQLNELIQLQAELAKNRPDPK